MITEVNQFIFQGDVPVRFNYGCRQYISKSLLVVLSDFHSSNSSGKLTWRTAYCCLFLISLCEALLYCRCKPVRWVLQTNKTKQNKQKKYFQKKSRNFCPCTLKKNSDDLIMRQFLYLLNKFCPLQRNHLIIEVIKYCARVCFVGKMKNGCSI